MTAPLTGVGLQEEKEKRVEGNRTLLYSKPSVDESEANVIWSSPHADVRLPSEVLGAFENYSSNLEDLPPLLD